MYAYLATAEGAVVMTNSDAGMALAREIINSTALEYGWPGFVSEELQRCEANLPDGRNRLGFEDG